MKNLYTKIRWPIAVVLLIAFFFIPSAIRGKIPFPADSLVGLYHPWRDNSYQGYGNQKFPVKNPLITDPILQTYPWRQEVISSIKNKEAPLWNPYSFSGQPLFANIQSATFSLLNINFFFLPFSYAWGLNIILTSILTGLFMYFFLKSMNLSNSSGFFGAIILPFSGFFVAWLEWGTVSSTFMYMPLILLSIKKMFSKNSPFWFLALAVAISQLIFAGHAQTGLYVLIVSILFIIYLSLKQGGINKSLFPSLAIALGLLITIVQLIPSYEFTINSARDIDQGYIAGREDWFLPLKNLIQFIVPDFFGNPATYNYWGVWNYAEFIGFIGTIPLMLAFVGFLKVKKSIFFLIILIFSLFFAIENPISKLPYTLNLPIISSMQPSRIIVLLCFALTSLAAIGLEAFNKEKEKYKFVVSAAIILLITTGTLIFSLFFKKYFPIFENYDPSYIATRNLMLPLIFSLLSLLICLLMFTKIPRKYLLILLLVLTTIDIYRFAYKFIPFSSISLIFPDTQITNYLKDQKETFRIITTDRRITTPNSFASYKIESTQGYDPLYLIGYAKLVSSWNEEKPKEADAFNRIVTPMNITSPIADMLGARFILTFDELLDDSFEKVQEEGITKLYRNNNALSRVFFVNSINKVENKDQEIAFLLQRTKNLKQEAVSSEFEFKSIGLKAEATIIETTSQKLKIRTDANKEAPLIVSNIYYPGWQAYIDNKKTPILRANYILQSIMIPKGEHQLTLIYSPKSFFNGLYISFTAIILTFTAALLIWKKKFQS